MRLKLPSTKLLCNGLALGLGLLICSAPLLALAQLEKPRRGIPGRRIPGGSRDPASCVAGSQLPLMALVPPSNQATTVSEYPTFFWYVPKNSAKSLDFELFELTEDKTKPDTQEKLVYRTSVKVPDAPGVISLTLPKAEGVQPLAPNKSYMYWFVLNCDAKDPLKDIYVGGYIQRVMPSATLAAQLRQAKPEDLPRLYASNGIWNETVATLAQLRQSKPGNQSLVSDWSDLLRSVKLDDYAQAPLLSCCTPNGSRASTPRRR